MLPLMVAKAKRIHVPKAASNSESHLSRESPWLLVSQAEEYMPLSIWLFLLDPFSVAAEAQLPEILTQLGWVRP